MILTTPEHRTSRAQFLRFCIVGASGYAVNIAAFAISLALCAHHLVAAGIGFAVAVASNFWLNRHWTFGGGDRALAMQAGRFLTVSLAACLVAVAILELLVGSAGLPALAAQPAAILAATPLSFLGSKTWAFAEDAPVRPAGPAQRLDTWLVVPTYNEADNLERFVRRVLPELAAAAGEHRVLIVDDSSPDGTGEIADRLAAELDAVEVLHRAEKDGLGRAYAAGFERALAEDAELVMQMDVDFSHDPRHIPSLIAAAADADLVIGSRYVAGGGVTDCRSAT
jgi:putative flippase GtrA